MRVSTRSSCVSCCTCYAGLKILHVALYTLVYISSRALNVEDGHQNDLFDLKSCSHKNQFKQKLNIGKQQSFLWKREFDTMKITPKTLSLALAMTAVVEGHRRQHGRVVATPFYTRDLEASFDWMNEILSIHNNNMQNLLSSQFWKDAKNVATSTIPSTPSRYAVSHNDETGITTLRMELPGVSAANLDVSLENDNLLRIQGKRHSLTDSVVEIDQSFQLETDIDPTSLRVTLQHGILQVTASKKTKTLQRLTIQTGEDENIPKSIAAETEKKNTDELVITEEE